MKIDDFDGAVAAVDRRRFVKGVGLAVLAVQCLPLLAQASGCAPSDGANMDGADGLLIRSGPGLLSHVHDLLIPTAMLETPPPQGVELETTRALLHTHRIALTRDELILVSEGGTVTRKASSHVLVIALANGQPPSAGRASGVLPPVHVDRRTG